MDTTAVPLSLRRLESIGYSGGAPSQVRWATLTGAPLEAWLGAVLGAASAAFDSAGAGGVGGGAAGAATVWVDGACVVMTGVGGVIGVGRGGV